MLIALNVGVFSMLYAELEKRESAQKVVNDYSPCAVSSLL